MLHKVLRSFAVVLFAISLAGSVYGEEVAGKISKVGDDGREISVKSKDGKEVTVKISGSRTTLDALCRPDIHIRVHRHLSIIGRIV